MSKPKRIQRSRAKGWKMPANAIYVGRPTVWGNPYVVGSELMNGETLTAEKAVELYEQHLADNFSERDIRHCLHGKDLACWCALDEPCHADVLLRIANSRPKTVNGDAADRPHKMTTKDTSVTTALSRPTPISSVLSTNSFTSSVMRWSGLSAASPRSCMR